MFFVGKEKDNSSNLNIPEESKDVTKFRVLSLITTIASKNQHCFSLCSTGPNPVLSLLKEFIKKIQKNENNQVNSSNMEVDSDQESQEDILEQLNVLHLVQRVKTKENTFFS